MMGCQSGCSEGELNLLARFTEPKIYAAPASNGNGDPTLDGTCGSTFGDTTCDGWKNGNCCSMYGYCGQSDAHCGIGCQSGNCLNGPAKEAPGPAPASIGADSDGFELFGFSGCPAMRKWH